MTAVPNSALHPKKAAILPDSSALYEQLPSLRLEPQYQKFNEWLREKYGYEIRNHGLFRPAITHSSLHRTVGYDYERLEFLGDGLLNLWITDLEVRAGFGCQGRRLGSRGELATFVSNEFLSGAARRSGLTDHALSNFTTTFTQGRKAAGDLVEAVTAAIFLDSASLEQAGAFVNGTLSHLRTFRKFLQQFQGAAISEDALVMMPDRVRAFIDRFGFNGRGDRLFATALLSDLAVGRHEVRFADLYGLGNRAHQLLCRLQVFAALPLASESELSRRAAEFGKEILGRMAATPLWAHCEPDLPGSAKDDPSLTRQRYHALLGAVYRLGGFPAVARSFGDLYRDYQAGRPPPAAPLLLPPSVLRTDPAAAFAAISGVARVA